MENISIGLNVIVKGKRGIVRFVGKTQFAPGNWVGVELIEETGKNNGSINGVEYFKCTKPGLYGLFVSPNLVEIPGDKALGVSPKKSQDKRLELIIDRLQLKLQDSLKEVKIYKEKVDQYKDVESQLESLTIDRDYFKDHSDDLKHQLDEMNKKYRQLSEDFEVLKEELEVNKQIEDEITMNESSDPTVLIAKIQRLELDIIGLKSFNETNELKLTNELLELSDKSVPKDDYELLKTKFTLAEETIKTLKTQLETINDSEDIINHLTDENNDLKDKINALTKQLDELIELQQLDDDLQENHNEIENQLNETIISLNQKLAEEKLKNERLVEPGEVSIGETNKLSKIIENLKVELNSKTRDYEYLNFLLKISNSQKLILNNHFKLKFDLLALNHIIEYLANEELEPYLRLIHQISEDGDVPIDDLITELLHRIQEHIITDLNVEKLKMYIQSMFDRIPSNRNYNKCCLDFISFRTDDEDIMSRIERLEFVDEVNERYNIDIDFEKDQNFLSLLGQSFTKAKVVEESVDKDKLINDLELTIQLMQNNLTMMNKTHQAKLNDLGSELNTISQQYNDLKNSYNQVNAKNDHLKRELDTLLDYDKILNYSYVKRGKETELIEKIGLIDEITFLRKKIRLQINPKQDLNWLKSPTHTFQGEKLTDLSSHLRKISNSVRLLDVQRGFSKRQDNPKFVVATINEQYSKYLSEREKIIRDV
ncbi:hypothetical protein CLIB1444_01S17040 [[Candida] jaroonii]|uniref:Uncharacterized protein n=1 Tax=[Candida] jaroonii TaxID=467808 RepID=A0ACA9Y1S2_9ASCO|nr:hypothetical protein CLIB1444_01S17040 [[Candida] jaroonii]